MRTIDEITAFIRDDLLRDSEQYFSNYVIEALNVRLPAQDGNWKSQISKRLSEEINSTK
jgi:hypothetical protein